MQENENQESGQEATASKTPKVKAPEKERQGAQFEGDVNAYKADPSNWANLSRVARDYGWQFVTTENAVTFDNIPAAQLRQAVTIAEAYRTRKLR